MIGLGESGYERQFWKSSSQKENLVTNCQTNSNRLSFFLTRAQGSRLEPDFAGLDRRKTGSWEEGSQQGTPDRCAPFQIVVRASNLKLPLTTDLGGWR